MNARRAFVSTKSVEPQERFVLRPTKRSLAMKASILVLVLMLAACASPGVAPNGELGLSMTAIEEARRNDAEEYAPAELKQAQDKLQQAQAAVQRKKFVTAKRLAEQAELDARLAQARAKSERAKRELAALNEDIRVLRERIR
jgi:peptidoglycan hydrolase CwlO-like protein